MIGTVDFTGHEEMYDKLESTGNITNEFYNDKVEKYMIFDDDNNTVWICWCEEALA